MTDTSYRNYINAMNAAPMPAGAMNAQPGGTDMPPVDMNAPVPGGAQAEGDMPTGAMEAGTAQGMPMGSMLGGAAADDMAQPGGSPGQGCGCG